MTTTNFMKELEKITEGDQYPSLEEIQRILLADLHCLKPYNSTDIVLFEAFDVNGTNVHGKWPVHLSKMDETINFLLREWAYTVKVYDLDEHIKKTISRP